MASLTVFGPGHTTGIDLGRNSFWRITLGAVGDSEMALMAIYPPGAAQNRIALARVHVGVAKGADELASVAITALSMGDLEKDIARASESMNLFKMHRHVNEETFKEATTNVVELVRFYWSLRRWLEEDTADNFDNTINEWRVKGKR